MSSYAFGSHGFWALASGDGNFCNTMSNALRLVNAPRIGAVMLPASGYVFIALQTNNSGAWLMHRHVRPYTSEGF
ncbi:hypothetical protein PENDEC_c006G01937 [Penicillium decumbens]|uniref:Plastocyanin-like domain-containing protein n=1 Tax=Penicillium decumbens TaxID=69771 RepID=A0A1V6PES3_PENDC|nr:hypothetical protein PENDEC_c006G01937 [Penicillium decumbens]